MKNPEFERQFSELSGWAEAFDPFSFRQNADPRRQMWSSRCWNRIRCRDYFHNQHVSFVYIWMKRTNPFILVIITIQLEKLICYHSLTNIVMLFEVSFSTILKSRLSRVRFSYGWKYSQILLIHDRTKNHFRKGVLSGKLEEIQWFAHFMELQKGGRDYVKSFKFSSEKVWKN